jgi:hypothetical protein
MCQAESKVEGMKLSTAIGARSGCRDSNDEGDELQTAI